MKNITIPVEVPSDVFISLNTSEQELKTHFQTMIAITLFQEGKVTIGKAVQLSGLPRFMFEKILAQNKIPISKLNIEEILSDVEKMKDL